jgi:integrase
VISINFEYVHRDVDRHGNLRLYFRRRKGERKIRIRALPGTRAFQVEYEAAKALAEAQPSPAGEVAAPSRLLPPKHGTYRWLCTQYFSCAEFRRLDSRTQRVRRSIIETTFDEPVAPGQSETFADFPLARMTAKAIRILRDRKANYPEAANARVKAVRQVFAWGIDQDHVLVNPARDVSYLRAGSSGFHSWSVEEVGRFEERHPLGTKARLALALLMYTGVRRADLVLLGRQHIRDGWFKIALQKNRNRKPITIDLPVLSALREIIDASPVGDLTFLVTQFGRPFTANGFGNWFRRRCDEAELPHCSAHGLRKAGAARAAENGATTHELMAIFGWQTVKEAERYTQAAQRKRLAASAERLLKSSKSG